MCVEVEATTGEIGLWDTGVKRFWNGLNMLDKSNGLIRLVHGGNFIGMSVLYGHSCNYSSMKKTIVTCHSEERARPFVNGKCSTTLVS